MIEGSVMIRHPSLGDMRVLRARQPAYSSSNSRRRHCPCVRTQCAATHSDGELDWRFDSLDSDDLGLPGFTVPRKSKHAELGHCYGCGVELQTENPRTPGFVNKDKVKVKSRHRQRDSVLCSR
jgi:hypothetical protein